MPEPLRQIVYISAARPDLQTRDLQEIFTASAAANAGRGITGLLLYRDLEFMQVLEGPPAEIEGLYLRICRDPRHTTIIKLLDRLIPEREFPDWAMQLVDARGALTEFRPFELDGIPPDPGFRGLAGTPGRAHHLLEHFRNALRR
jgi:hypothetical protein